MFLLKVFHVFDHQTPPGVSRGPLFFFLPLSDVCQLDDFFFRKHQFYLRFLTLLPVLRPLLGALWGPPGIPLGALLGPPGTSIIRSGAITHPGITISRSSSLTLTLMYMCPYVYLSDSLL